MSPAAASPAYHLGTRRGWDGYSWRVVEHDMVFVRSLGARVNVLHKDAVLADGSIDHVRNDPRVIEVYLGR